MFSKKINNALIYYGVVAAVALGSAPFSWAEGPTVLDRAREAVSAMTNRLSTAGQIQESDTPPKLGFYDQDRRQLLKTLRDPFVPQVPSLPPAGAREDEPVVSNAVKPAIPPASPSPGTANQTETIIERPVIKISGIVWNTDRPQAIIDDEVVDIGDRVKGFSVTGITREGITLTFEDTTFVFEP